MASDDHVPWTAKYAPQTLAQLQGQNAAAEQLRQFIARHAPGQICLLHGPPGCGKTALVHALSREHDAELLEVNASDVRSEAAIEAVLGPALKQRSLFAQTKIILFDEIDGLSGTKDRGGLSALMRLAQHTPYPVVCVANDPWDGKFSELRRRATMIKMNGLAYTSIAAVLRRIADAEGVRYDDEGLKALSRRAGGDCRAAITDLQVLGPAITKERVETLSSRDSAANIFESVRIVLKTRDPAIARQAIDSLQEDADEIFLWVDENVGREYTKPKDRAAAYDALSRADVYRGRIRRWQHWRYLVYVYDLLGPGVALSKAEKYEGFSQLQRTQRLLAVWRSKSAVRDQVVQKLGREQHTSKAQARRELRLLRPVLAGAEFLDDEERDWLSGARRPKRGSRG